MGRTDYSAQRAMFAALLLTTCILVLLTQTQAQRAVDEFPLFRVDRGNTRELIFNFPSIRWLMNQEKDVRQKPRRIHPAGVTKHQQPCSGVQCLQLMKLMNHLDEVGKR